MPPLPVAVDISLPVAALSAAFGAAYGGPWQFNGALYLAVTDHTYSAFTAIYKSTNGGASWSPLDTAGQPATSQIVQFDGNHTLVAAFSSAGNFLEGPIHLQNFDLSTETWGAPYGTSGSPTGYITDLVGFRPDGSIVVLYQHSFGGNPSANFFAAFASGAWSAPLQIDVNYAGPILAAASNLMTAAIDSAGNVHAFMALSASGSNLPWNVFYQEVTALNALGSFHTFPDSNNGNLISLGVPAMLGGKVFLPAFVSDAGAVGYFWGIGTSWGSVVGPIDPGLAGDATLVVDTSSTPGFALVVGGTLTFIYTAQGSNTAWIQARMRLLQTTSLADPSTGWTGQTIADAETFPSSLLPIAPPASQRILGLGPYLPGVGNVFNMFEPQSASFDQAAFFLSIPSGPAPIPPPIKITFRGVKRVRCAPIEEDEIFDERSPQLPRVKRAM